MKNHELEYYEKIGNWDFSEIKYKTEKIIDWNFYKEIEKHTNRKSLCLDIGTGGGEKVLEKYPDVGMIIATDFSNEMVATAQKNLKGYPNKKIKFMQMDNLNMKFPDNMFDLISARHTVIDAKQIYNALSENGALIIEGVDKKDCWSLKQIFGRGQAYKDEVAISEKDYQDVKMAGFSKMEKVEVLENEYYETKEDLLALLLKTPILDDFSEIDNGTFKHNSGIETELLDEYIKKYKTGKGILLERVLYGIIACK